MVKKVYRVQRSAKTGSFVVNGEYVRKQAGEAITTFFAPLSGAWDAAKSAGEPPKEKTHKIAVHR